MEGPMDTTLKGPRRDTALWVWPRVLLSGATQEVVPGGVPGYGPLGGPNRGEIP